MSFTKRFLITCFVILPHICLASISVEPFVGYGLFLKNSKAYHTFPSIGGRIGYSRWGLMMGVDLGFSYQFPVSYFNELEIQQPDSHNTGFNQVVPSFVSASDSKYFSFSTYSIGPSISFGLPLILDAYASLIYIASNSNKSAEGQGFTMDGVGLKLGVSYLSLPFLSFNLEFQALNYLKCHTISSGELCKSNSQEIGFTGMTYIFLINLSSPISTGLL